MQSTITKIRAEEISSTILTSANYGKYKELLERFNSRSSTINTVIHNRPGIIQSRGDCYDNRDCVILFLLNHNSKTDLIAYASFAASSLKYKIEGEDIVIPAIVINTFAIDQKYKKSLYAVISSEKFKDGSVVSKNKSCASFCIEYLMHYLDTESAKIGATHVYLYAEKIYPKLPLHPQPPPPGTL